MATGDYYALLGLRADASDEEIRSAYRELARILHPDVNPGAASAALFKQITAAYDVLSDPERRRRFDNPAPPPSPPPPQPAPPPPPRTAEAAGPWSGKWAKVPDGIFENCGHCGEPARKGTLKLTAVSSGAEKWCPNCVFQRDRQVEKARFWVIAVLFSALCGAVVWFVVGAFHAGPVPVLIVVGSFAAVLVNKWIEIHD